ncbi:uncharacterized protein LOC105695860 [Orussus abietinus]|uniref:uncharacterized protein LOC105695860 n=1 Tax=Orussus abietinus TaxID=222816 RepID=UPI0006266B4D|nr:uncharacterized protein LOC105695860 [Orussus abietinus]
MVMTSLKILAAALIVFIPQISQTVGKHLSKDSSSGKGDTVIENKNVNIIVNADPKLIAEELWKVILAYLDEKPSSTLSAETIKELIRIVAPVRGRRSGLSAFEMSYDLEQVARRSLALNSNLDPVDREIKAKDMAAEMMSVIKDIEESPEQQKLTVTGRRLDLTENVDNYVEIRVKMNQRDLMDAVKDESS